MIRSFKDNVTRDIFHGRNSKVSRRVPKNLHRLARRKLDYIEASGKLDDLKIPPNNRLHALSGDLKGFHAISINDQFRIVFKWKPEGVENVWITDYH